MQTEYRKAEDSVGSTIIIDPRTRNDNLAVEKNEFITGQSVCT